MAMPLIQIKPVFIAAIVIGLTMSAVSTMAQLGPESDQTLATPVEPLRSGATEGQIFAELLAHNDLRKTALADYSALRTYQVVDLNGKVHAEEIGGWRSVRPTKKHLSLRPKKGQH